jgi:tetratricopeptide (TPR) repeat protein
MRRFGVVAFVLLALSCGGGSIGDLEASLGTARVVRGSTEIHDATGTVDSSASLARIPAGGSVIAPAHSLVRVTLDGGAAILLDGGEAGAELSFGDDSSVSIVRGRVLVDVGFGDALAIETPAGRMRIADGAASIDAGGGERDVQAYVVRGEASYVGCADDEPRGTARAGEHLALTAACDAVVTPEALWVDWTGGLVRAGPTDPSAAPGMGTLEARVPDEVGQARWPLVIRRLDVQVEIVGELAITEVEEVFFNPASETVEGLYRVTVPEGAVLERFAVDRNGALVEGYVREQAQALAAYEAQVYRGSTEDPALLEWDAPGRYRARIYPIGAGEVRRIAIRYAEWLPRAHEGGALLYRYPMAGTAGRTAPHIADFSFVADFHDAGASRIRAGLGATVEGDRVELRRSDFSPRADLWLELTPSAGDSQRAYRASHTPPARAPGSRTIVNEADERDYWYLPLRLPESLFASEAAPGLDLVIAVDVSAGTDRAHLELGRSVAEAIAAHLGPNDRVSIVTSDLAIRSVGDGMALGDTSASRVETLLDGLAEVPAGGATDLGTVISEAGALLDPARDGAVIYVGDGAPTVGELEADELIAHLLAQPHPVRLYAVAIGEDANVGLLEALTHGGGLAMRVEEREDAADAAMSILAHVSRPVLSHVSVALGDGIENAFPRVPVDVVRGDTLEVSGRVSGSVPTDVVVSGTFRGAPFEQHVAVRTQLSDAEADLRLRWASERLRQQLREGSTREEIAELGTRYGLITPYTSYYVPSASELSRAGLSQLRHAPLLSPRQPDTALASTVFAIALGPLSLAGCCMSGGGASPSGDFAPSGGPMPIVTAPPTDPGASERTELERPNEVAEMPMEPTTTPTTATPPPMIQAPSPERYGDEADRSMDGLLEGALGASPGPMRSRAPRTSAAPSTHSSPAHHRPRMRSDADPNATAAATTARPVFAATYYDGASAADAAARHARARCSGASQLALEDRRGLFRERLLAASSPSEWTALYREARTACEIDGPRERRAYLDELLDRAGSVPAMAQLHALIGDASARAMLYGAILRRVRSPEDLRVARGALGLSSYTSWVLVQQVLARAHTPAARLHALRTFYAEAPTNTELATSLLTELERQDRVPEARRLASRLRADPVVGAELRSAIGEMYLRQHDEDEARRAFSEIVELAPMDELARRRVGDLYRAHGWFDDAYRQYQTLASIRPDDTSVLLLLALAAGGAGRTDEALRLEQRVMEMAPPGMADGPSRSAQLWSSVRFAHLRNDARAAGNETDLAALGSRMRRGGVLRNAGDLRVTLTWAHPDAQLSLWAAYPGLPLGRPEDMAGELGIEAFDLAEQEEGQTYRIEVRRGPADRLGMLHGELVVVWHEGRADEQIRIVPIDLYPGQTAAFSIVDRNFLP